MRHRILTSLLVGTLLALLGHNPSHAAMPMQSPIDTIVFGSCIRGDEDQTFWKTLSDEDPDLALFLGDNVYGDDEDPDLPVLRAAYRALENQKGFQQLRAQTTMLATWDDHDYGRNDGGADYPLKRASEHLFETFWNYGPDSDVASRDGIYHVRHFGPVGQRVQVILLDTRFFRSALTRKEWNDPILGRYQPNPDPSATLLGPDQWAWLEKTLSEPADLRILASSIQVIAEGHAWERWGNLPLERQRLYDALSKASGATVVLSGDRHRGAIYKKDIGANAPLIEMTSSSLNASLPWGEPGPFRLGDMVGINNYGTVRIDWQARTVLLSLHATSDGETLRSIAVDF